MSGLDRERMASASSFGSGVGSGIWGSLGAGASINGTGAGAGVGDSHSPLRERLVPETYGVGVGGIESRGVSVDNATAEVLGFTRRRMSVDLDNDDSANQQFLTYRSSDQPGSVLMAPRNNVSKPGGALPLEPPR